MDLRRSLAIVRRRLPFVLACAVLGALVAFFVVRGQTPKFEAQTTLLVGPSIADSISTDSGLLVPQYVSQVYVRMATAPETLAGVITELGLNTTPAGLAQQIVATSGVSPTTVTIAATASESDTAVAIANSVAEQLMGAAASASTGDGLADQAGLYQEGMRRSIASTLAEINALQAVTAPTVQQSERLELLRSQLATQVAGYTALTDLLPNGTLSQLTVLSAATSPAQVAPRTTFYTMLAFVLVFLLASGWSALLEYVDRRMRDRADVEEVSGLTTLGTVGRFRGSRWSTPSDPLPTYNHPRSKEADAYRSIRTRIGLEAGGRAPHVLLVTSTDRTRGKSIVATNLAVAFAQSGRDIVLIEADLRHPEVASRLQLPAGRGLTGLMTSDDVDPVDVVRSAGLGAVSILQAGQAVVDPTAVLESERMRAIVDAYRGRFDVVIFDAPPVNEVDDAIVLASMSDAAVLVVDMDHGDRDALVAAQEALATSHARVLGTVLVGGTAARGGQRGYRRPKSDHVEGPTAYAVEHPDPA